MLSAQLRGKGKKGFPTLHKHFEPLNWSPDPKIPVAIFLFFDSSARWNYFVLDKHTVGWQKAERCVVIYLFHQQDEGIPLSKAFSLQPIILCLPIQKAQLHPELGCRRSESPKSSRWNLFLGRCELYLVPITSNNPFTHHLIQIPRNRVQSTDSDPSNLLSLRISALPVQEDKVSSGCQLEVIPHPALQSHLVGPSNALKDIPGQQGCHRSRKGGGNTTAQLPHCTCVWGWQVHWQLFLSFLDFYVCLKSCTGSAIETGTQKIGLEMPR